MATKKARELRKTPVKDIFGCRRLVNREAKRFSEWFRRSHGHEAGESRPAEIARALYAYCAPPNFVSGEEAKTGTGRGFSFSVFPREMEKSMGLFPRGEASLKNLLEERRGQCTAFTSLYCALAEEFGLAAKPFVVEEFDDGTHAGAELFHVVPAFIPEKGKPVLFDLTLNKPNAKYKGRLAEKEELKLLTLNFNAHSLYYRGDPATANSLADKALEIDPGHVVSLTNKAQFLEDLGKTSEAMKCYDKALKLDPRDSMALHGKGVMLLAAGKAKEALPFFQRAHESDPTHPGPLIFKGITLNQLGEYKKAIEAFDKVRAMPMEHPFRSGELVNLFVGLASGHREFARAKLAEA